MNASKLRCKSHLSPLNNGAVAWFIIGVMPYAILNSYIFSLSGVAIENAIMATSVIGCTLFFVVNRITDKYYDFSYKPTIKTFLILTLQVMAAVIPAALIPLVFTMNINSPLLLVTLLLS